MKDNRGEPMFFIMGLSQSQKKLNFVQNIVCSRCGKFGRYEVFMTYTYFSLFFIPIIKWNKQFLVKSTCCNTTYTIDTILGKRILKGEPVELKDSDLHQYGSTGTGYNGGGLNRCPGCGYEILSEYSYCPKCGARL